MGFPRPRYRTRLPFPPPGDLPDPGITPPPPAAPAGGVLTAEPPGRTRETASAVQPRPALAAQLVLKLLFRSIQLGGTLQGPVYPLRTGDPSSASLGPLPRWSFCTIHFSSSLRGQEEKGAAEHEMVGWHHRPNGLESDQTLGDGEGQGCLVYRSPWG